MFKNLSIKLKLSILIGLLSLLLVAIGLVGLYGMNQTVAGLKTMYEDRAVPLADLGDIRKMLLNNRLSVAAAQLNPEADFVRQQMDAVDANIIRITAVWDKYMQTYLTPEEAGLAEQFARDRGAFVEEGLKPAAAALRAKDFKGANEIMLSKIRPLYVSAAEGLDKLTGLQVRVAEQEYNHAQETYTNIRNLAIGSISIGQIVAIAMGYLLVLSITSSLNQAVTLADSLSQGNLTTRIEINSNDEVGLLLTAMKNMAVKLSQIIGDVRGAAASLSSASEQVSATAQTLSQGASEQAASVEQTSASVEQMSASIKQNSDNAKVTDSMSSKACKEAAEGGMAVSKTVNAMKSIAEKISIIDDIAYQTNLLALNAAIEAARAGEHGKGFAVVAAEVRKLAERSQVAAQEIGEVAKNSVSLAEQAGSLFREMVPSIQKTSDLVQEIAAASQEQSTGASQINQAMEQLSSITQQSASSSEELAATAEELNSQAEQLQELMEFFTLDAESGKVVSMHARATKKNTSRPLKSVTAKAVGDDMPFDAEFVKF